MKKYKKYYIGLLPDSNKIKGKNPNQRIQNYAKNLGDKKDKRDFLILQKFIDKKLFDAAKIMFWDLDTAVRDTFYNVYTNNEKNKLAKVQLMSIFEIEKKEII